MGGANIDLLLVGVSHRTAPVAVRERLAVEPDAVPAALAELTALGPVREAAMLATCNRVELYVAVDDADRAAAGLAEVLARRAGVAVGDLAEHLYQHRDAAAVRHLFRVASSLDSLVVGEPQILGQAKQAHDAAVQHGNPHLANAGVDQHVLGHRASLSQYSTLAQAKIIARVLNFV